MTAQTKYPNADTSPERLARIIQALDPNDPMDLGYEGYNAVRDLLAMLEERIDAVKLASSVMDELGRVLYERDELRQQLHDQRWRYMEIEWPIQGQEIQVCFIGTASETIYNKIEIFNRKDYTDGSGMWWRPIPPLPLTYPVKLQRKHQENNP